MLHYTYLDSLWFGGTTGLVTCKLFLGIISVAPYVSVWILVTIAIDRFYAVTRPLRSSPISQHLKKTILLLWVCSFACSINVFVNGSLKKIRQSYYCDLESVVTVWIAFNITDVALSLFLPLLIIVVLYTFVCLKLWSREVPGEGTNQNERQAEATKTARKVTRMMIVIVALFALCWIPFFITFALQVFGSMQISATLILFMGWLTVCYSSFNPYIYFTFNQKFRFNFKELIGKILRKISILQLCFLTSQSHSIELPQV